MPGPPKDTGRRRPGPSRLVLVVVLLGVVAGVFAFLGFDPYPSTIGDNAEFVILSRSVLAGKGFSYINHPEERPATKYPPGFPLMLAAWGAFFGTTFVSLKLFVALTYVGAVVLTFILGRRLIGDNLALVAALMVASSSSFIRYSHTVLSEMPYALFSLVLLYFVMYRPPGRRSLIATALLCVWVYYVRTVGGTLVLAVAVYHLLETRRKYGLILLAVLVTASVAWALRNYAAAGEGSRYLSVLMKVDPYHPHKGDIDLADLIVRMGRNLLGYTSELIAYTVLPSYHVHVAGAEVSLLRNLVSVGVVAFAAVGGYTLRRKAVVVNLYLLLYLLAYLIWPDVWMSDRFMIPIAPLVAIYAVQGIYRVCTLAGLPRRAAVAACIAVMLTNAYALKLYVARERGYMPLWANYIQCALWSARNTRPDDIFICRKPFFFYIFSDRRTVSYPFTPDKEKMKDYFRESGADYVVVDYFGGPGSSTTELYLLPVLVDMLDSIKTVYSTGEPLTMVVRLNVGRKEQGR